MKKEELEKIEKICYEKFIDSNGNIALMSKNAEKLNMSLGKFLVCSYKYIENNINKPEYVKILDSIYLLNTDEEIIHYIKSLPFNYKYIKDNLLSYFIYYRPHIYYLNQNKVLDLRTKLKIYENYIYREVDPLRTSLKKDGYEINLIKEFINSNYSLTRFCFNKGITTLDFKTNVAKVKKLDKDLYNNYVENLNIKNDIKEKQIKQDIINILNIIKENNGNISLIELCLLTNYDILELIKEADKMLNIDDIKLFRLNVRSKRQINTFNNDVINKLFETKFTFNINGQLMEINDEDKYAILSYMYQNNIPICNESFRECSIKLCSSKQENIKLK